MDETRELGFCERCIRVRWLDRPGVCSQCAREEREAEEAKAAARTWREFYCGTCHHEEAFFCTDEEFEEEHPYYEFHCSCG